MPELGQFALRLGLFLSVYAILMDLLGRLAASRRAARQRAQRHRRISAVPDGRRCGARDPAGARRFRRPIRGGEYRAGAAAGVQADGVVGRGGWVVAAVAVASDRLRRPGLLESATGTPSRFCASARAAANLVAVFFFLVLIFDKDPFGLSVTTPRTAPVSIRCCSIRRWCCIRRLCFSVTRPSPFRMPGRSPL